MKNYDFNKLANQIGRKTKGLKKNNVSYWLLLIFSPSVFLIDETGKDKTGTILFGITVALCVIFLFSLIFLGKANGLCLIGYVAVNVWGWMQLVIEKRK